MRKPRLRARARNRARTRARTMDANGGETRSRVSAEADETMTQPPRDRKRTIAENTIEIIIGGFCASAVSARSVFSVSSPASRKGSDGHEHMDG